MKDDEERCLQAGMDGYVAKPVTGMKLREVLDAAARNRIVAPV